MEAFRSIKLGHQPPAGNPVRLSSSPLPATLVEGYSTLYTRSGTSALALALCIIKEKQNSIKNPEVIMPAYCCPDLLSAAVFAGLKPVLVDIQSPFDPGYHLKGLASAITNQTIAIICVNFLGISERIHEIKALLSAIGHSAAIIEDNAQWFPEKGGAHQKPSSDFSIVSFGRGKPVSLLGGGALLCKQPEDIILGKSFIEASAPERAWKYIAKVFAYNQLLRPQFYQLLSLAPFLKLGETCYHHLEKIEKIPSENLQFLNGNLTHYITKSRKLEQFYKEVIIKTGGALFELSSNNRQDRLLRYPVLCSNESQRNSLLSEGKALGFSSLYKTPLINIPGVSKYLHPQATFKNAEHFAKHLLTFPLHQGITEEYQSAIDKLIQKTASTTV